MPDDWSIFSKILSARYNNWIPQPPSLDAHVRDPIWGMIKLDWYLQPLIDHPIFQRLRKIHHLGLANLVYPGANHSRFEHSIGVAHIAGKILEGLRAQLKKRNDYEVRITEEMIIELKITGLLHDVGHLPFSHVGERVFEDEKVGKSFIDQLKMKKKLKKKIVPHEIISAFIVDSKPLKQVYNYINELSMRKEFGGKEIKIDPQNLQNMILGVEPKDKRNLFLSQIINGQMDADKVDYILRDSHYSGSPHGWVDIARLQGAYCIISKEEVIGSQTNNKSSETLVLGIDEKGISCVLGIRIAKIVLSPNVYQHHAVAIAELMLYRAIKSVIINEKKRIKRTKSQSKILKENELIHILPVINDNDLFIELKKRDGFAREMVKRIENREIYKRVYECFPNFQVKDLEPISEDGDTFERIGTVLLFPKNFIDNLKTINPIEIENFLLAEMKKEKKVGKDKVLIEFLPLSEKILIPEKGIPVKYRKRKAAPLFMNNPLMASIRIETPLALWRGLVCSPKGWVIQVQKLFTNLLKDEDHESQLYQLKDKIVLIEGKIPFDSDDG
ncbi:MAG: HD domain-containing protein [Promethearchaeota archaeon]